MHKLVLIRHGQSLLNQENRFAGWLDVDLSVNGIEEAKHAARLLRESNLTFDICFTSFLKRAIRTLWIILDELDLMWTPTYKSWRLNEKHYGILQGMNKKETALKFGEEQIFKWRRAFDVAPPPINIDDPNNPRFDVKYRDIDEGLLPSTESLKDAYNRVMPYWNEEISPRIRESKRVLVVAHGNSIRSIAKTLSLMTDDEIAHYDIPTGFPLVYELDENLRMMKSYYLGDQETVKKKIEEVKNQAKVS